MGRWCPSDEPDFSTFSHNFNYHIFMVAMFSLRGTSLERVVAVAPLFLFANLGRLRLIAHN